MIHDIEMVKIEKSIMEVAVDVGYKKVLSTSKDQDDNENHVGDRHDRDHGDEE